MTTELEAFTTWLVAPDTDGVHLNEPPDGSLILVDEESVWVRTDEPEAAEHAERLEPGAWIGDWWELATANAQGPMSLGEVLDTGPRAADDPARRVRSFEVLYTGADVARLAKTCTEATENITMTTPIPGMQPYVLLTMRNGGEGPDDIRLGIEYGGACDRDDARTIVLMALSEMDPPVSAEEIAMLTECVDDPSLES